MAHPAYFRPVAVTTTPSRRLNTLAARAEAHGLGVVLERTIDGDNGYTTQYAATVLGAPGYTMRVLATRDKTRWPLRSWHFHLAYRTPRGETQHHMKRWDDRVVGYFYRRLRNTKLIAASVAFLLSPKEG